MGKQVRKVLILTGVATLVLFGGAMTSYAVGPGENASQTAVAKPTTYNQQAVKELGSWEQQGSIWKFCCLDGSYLTNSWISSLAEESAYYYVDGNGVMLTNSQTPDGYWVDGNGIWRSGLSSNVPSISESSSSESINSNTRDDEISPEAREMIEKVAGNHDYGNLH